MTLFDDLPKSWKLVSLGELSQSIQYGLNEKSSDDKTGILYLRITDIGDDGDLRLVSPKFVSTNTPQISSYAVELGDLLIARSGSVGLSYVHLSSGISMVYASYLIRFKLNQTLVDPEYIGFFARSPFYWHYVNKIARGVTVQNINAKHLSRLPIPLPALPEQREIVKILHQADHLRKLRASADKQSEVLAVSVFNQILGVKDNAISYPNSKLGKIAEVVSGVTKGRNLPARETVNVPYLRVANVQAGHLDLTEIKTIDVLPSDVEKYALQPGDVLLTEGGDFDKLGRGAILEQEIPNCIHQNHVFRVRVNTEVLLPLFFHYYLQTVHARQYFLRAAKRTTNLASINITQLNAMPVPIPPRQLQEKFVNAVNQIRSMLKTQASTAKELDRLFKTAMVNAFTGNLTRSYRERNLLELSRLAKNRDEALSQPAGQLELQQSESSSGIKRSFVRDTLSPSQQALLASIETQGIYLPSGYSEVIDNLPPNEVSRNLELLVQLGLIKVASIPVTPGKLGQIFYTKAYRSLQPKDNMRDTDLQTLSKAPQE